MSKAAIRSERGQRFMKEMLQALDALPKKELIEGMFECDEGVCALGAVGRARGINMDMMEIDGERGASCAFDIDDGLVMAIIAENDYGGTLESPEQRFVRMRKWVTGQILE